MLLTDYNKEVFRDNAMIKIGRATGISNFSNSSKVKTIADIVSNDVFLFIDEAIQSTNNLYEETATGRYLELLGAKHGVYRRSVADFDVSVADQIFKIVPQDNDDLFEDIFTSTKYIYAGESIEVSSGIKMFITETVEIGPESTDVYVAARLVSDGTSDISLSTGDMIKFGKLIDIENSSSIAIRVEKIISLLVSQDTDDQLRQRIINARNSRKDIAIYSAIQNVLLDIPGGIEFKINNNEGGAGNIEIFFITKAMKDGLVDGSAELLKRLIKGRLRGIIAEGITFSVELPVQLEAYITYELTSDTEIDEDILKSVIYNAFKTRYVYGSNSSILTSDIETYVKTKLPLLTTFNIVNVGLFDSTISSFINSGNNRVIEPKGTYIIFSKNNIGPV